MIKEIITYSEGDTFQLGNKLSGVLSCGDVVGLTGELGAGKTVLIKGILNGLGYDSRNVVSASFVIAQEYKAKFPVVHIDLYRFENNEEINYLDWDSYLSQENILLIEWVEKVNSFIPLSIKIKINIVSLTVRKVVLETEEKKFQTLF